MLRTINKILEEINQIGTKYSAGGPPWTYYINQNIGKYFTYIFWKTKVSSNMVTLLGAFVDIIAVSLLIWRANGLSIWWVVAIGIMWQIGYSLDCSDGQLARLTGKGSKFGAWFDLMIDFVDHPLIVGAAFYVISRSAWGAILIQSHPWAFLSVFTFCLVGIQLGLFSSSIKKLTFGAEKRILGKQNDTVKKALRATYTILDYGFFLFLVAVLLIRVDVLFYVLGIYAFGSYLSVGATGFFLYRQRD